MSAQNVDAYSKESWEVKRLLTRLGDIRNVMIWSGNFQLGNLPDLKEVTSEKGTGCLRCEVS